MKSRCQKLNPVLSEICRIFSLNIFVNYTFSSLNNLLFILKIVITELIINCQYECWRTSSITLLTIFISFYFSRLYVLQMALITQEWRVTELLENILSYLEPHLDHPYKNVRDRIGRYWPYWIFILPFL